MDFEAGEIVYFNKPLRWTSFDLVNKFRYKLTRKLGVKKIKVGHAGTLDPQGGACGHIRSVGDRCHDCLYRQGD